MKNKDIEKLFVKENKIINDSIKVYNDSKTTKIEIKNNFNKLITEYQKLLKQFQKVLKISDNQAKILDQQKEKLIKLTVDKNEFLEKEVLLRTEELKKKNITLEEILQNLHKEKESLQEIVCDNIEILVSSQIKKIKLEVETGKNAKALQYLKILEKNLDEICSPFTDKFKKLKSSLTAQEYQICEFIRSGMRAKEIAMMLNVTEPTVKWHKKKITEKLQLNKQNIKLKDYLVNM